MKTFKAKARASTQGELFADADIASIYQAAPDSKLENRTLYALLARRAGIAPKVFDEKVPVGLSGQFHSIEKRKIRRAQQNLRHANIIERVPGERGVWQLTEEARRGLNFAKPGVKVLGFRTDLGIAVFGNSREIFQNMDMKVSLVCTSPPYALSRPRAYGNPDQREIVRFILETLEPLIDRLCDGGSLALNVSNDIFLPGSPARSTYLERLVIALEDAGLELVERLVWASNKPPGPTHWASITRQHLNVGYEPILVFAKNARLFKGNNRRVLEPHSARHKALIANGGEDRTAVYGDGAYRVRKGSYGVQTAGRIPTNVLQRGNRCPYGNRYRAAAASLDLPMHGATQPFSVAEFLIKWLTDEGDLVVDPFGAV